MFQECWSHSLHPVSKISVYSLVTLSIRSENYFIYSENKRAIWLSIYPPSFMAQLATLSAKTLFPWRQRKSNPSPVCLATLWNSLRESLLLKETKHFTCFYQVWRSLANAVFLLASLLAIDTVVDSSLWKDLDSLLIEIRFYCRTIRLFALFLYSW